MIVIALAVLAAATTPGGSPRKALSDCLNALVDPAVKAGTKPPEFVDVTKQNCATQKAALHDYLLRENRASGMNANASEADAKDQVQELIDRVKDKYQDWWDTQGGGKKS